MMANDSSEAIRYVSKTNTLMLSRASFSSSASWRVTVVHRSTADRENKFAMTLNDLTMHALDKFW